MKNNDLLSLTFAALADPTRRTILERLTTGDVGVVDLTSAFSLTQPAISRHLKVLEHAGLICRTHDGQRRPARLRIEGLVPVDDWLRRANAEWSDRLERLDIYLASQSDASAEGSHHE